MKIRIAEIRREKGIKQDELAEKIGVSRPYLSQLETGSRTLTTQQQKEIAAALGVEPASLVDFEAPERTDEELLLSAFRSLSSEQREVWLRLAKVSLSSE